MKPMWKNNQQGHGQHGLNLPLAAAGVSSFVLHNALFLILGAVDLFEVAEEARVHEVVLVEESIEEPVTKPALRPPKRAPDQPSPQTDAVEKQRKECESLHCSLTPSPSIMESMVGYWHDRKRRCRITGVSESDA